MKNKFLFFGFLFIIASFFRPFETYAKSYSIDKVDIKAVLNTDGSMNVEENRIYNFDGDYTFAYEYFKKNGERNTAYILNNFEVCDDVTCYKQLDSNDKETYDEKRPTSSFYVDDQSDRYYVKWFYRTNSQIKNFKIKYKIENAVTLQQDVAELYWQWIGGGWEISQNNISVDVSLPDGIGENIKAFGHGPTNGIVSISDDSKNVNFKVDYLSSGAIFEGRILLPKDIFTNGVIDNLTKTEIEQQENIFIEKTINDKKDNKIIEVILAIISIILFGLGIKWFIKQISIFIKIWKDFKLPKVNLSGRIWEPPSDIDPAQVEQLILGYKGLTPKSFTATILSLVQHRFYKINRSEQKEGFLFKDYKYYLVPLEKSDIHATTIEKYVLDFLREINNETLELKEIADWCKTHQTKSYKFFKKLPEIVLEENLNEGFLEEIPNKEKNIKGIIFMILIIFGEFIIAGMGSKYQSVTTISVISIFILTILMFVCVFIYAFNEKRTKSGSLETAKWIAFKKHMKEYGQTKNYPIDSIILWEKYLIYGTVLGVSTKALSALPVNFSNTDKTVLVAAWGGSVDANSAVSMANVFSSINSITTNMTTAASSYGASGSGSSGGFSGGGGGGGGASGGGAG